MAAPDADLAAWVAAIDWYHQLVLPGGIVTNGVTDPSRSLPRLHLPASLRAKTVLDVGAWDGFYSFECARRGASRVLATDSYAWSGASWGTQNGFLLAREALGLDDVVADQLIDVMDLSPEKTDGPFDVVLFLGVVYHLTDAITALERVASCCNELLILETETALNWLPYEAARLYSGTGLNNDPTNWYQYNVKALKGLLRELGFRNIEVKYRTPLHRRAARAVREKKAGAFRSQRIVLHAYK